MAELFQYLSVDRRLRGKLSRFPSLLEERKGMNASSSFRRFSQNFLGVSNVCPNLCIRRFVTVFRWVGPQERLIDSRGGCFSQFLAKRLPLNQISGFVTAFGVGGAHKKWLIFLRDTSLPSLRSGSGNKTHYIIIFTSLNIKTHRTLVITSTGYEPGLTAVVSSRILPTFYTTRISDTIPPLVK